MTQSLRGVVSVVRKQYGSILTSQLFARNIGMGIKATGTHQHMKGGEGGMKHTVRKTRKLELSRVRRLLHVYLTTESHATLIGRAYDMSNPESVIAFIDLIEVTLDRAHLISGDKKGQAILLCEHKDCDFHIRCINDDVESWKRLHGDTMKEETGKRHKQYFVWWF